MFRSGFSAALALACVASSIFVLDVSNAQEVDRSAVLRFTWQAAPAAYDPPFAKNQFQITAYTFPIYDSLVRLDAAGNIVPCLATSWTFSDEGLTLTMNLRGGVKFTDGSDLTAAVVVKSLDRTKNNPESLMAAQLGSFESFEAPDHSTVVLHLVKPNPNALFPLATLAGMVVSGKALDDGVDLAQHPVGSGPYRLVSSGPEGAVYERNDAYFDPSQNQLAKIEIMAINDVNARMNAVQTGQADAGFFEVFQWPQIEALVSGGDFQVHKVLQPNSFPLWLNTSMKPFDDPKVRMAMNLAIDREAINQGIQNGECQPAGQPLQPGVVGHDDSLAPPAVDLEKAKALLAEAGVGPFSFDALAPSAEPPASIAIAVQQQLQALGITMNIIPTPFAQMRPAYRGGKYAAMLMTVSAPTPDPATIMDALFTSPDNQGGVTPELAKAIEDARQLPIDSPQREAAYKSISQMEYDDPRHLYVCWSPILVLHDKQVVGVEQEAYLNAVPIPDLRTYGILKQ